MRSRVGTGVTLPAGASPGVLEETTYIAFPQVVFTSAQVPDDQVYAMARAMYEGSEAMVSTFPPMRAFNPQDMRGDNQNVPFHPGALRFFEEVGLN